MVIQRPEFAPRRWPINFFGGFREPLFLVSDSRTVAPSPALGAKVCAFLLPLAAWALLCLLWVPDVIILDQGEGVYKPGDRVARTNFEAENARILASRTEPTLKITDKSFQTLRIKGVPDSVINRLNGIKGSMKDRASLSFENRKELGRGLKYSLEKEELEKYGDKILDTQRRKISRL